MGSCATFVKIEVGRPLQKQQSVLTFKRRAWEHGMVL